MNPPSIAYGQLAPMLIVFGVAVAGVLVEAFVPRKARYRTQLTLRLAGPFVALIWVPRIPLQPPGRCGQSVLAGAGDNHPHARPGSRRGTGSGSRSPLHSFAAPPPCALQLLASNS